MALTTGKNFLSNSLKKYVANKKKNAPDCKVTKVLFLGEIKASAYTFPP